MSRVYCHMIIQHEIGRCIFVNGIHQLTSHVQRHLE